MARRKRAAHFSARCARIDAFIVARVTVDGLFYDALRCMRNGSAGLTFAHLQPGPRTAGSENRRRAHFDRRDYEMTDAIAHAGTWLLQAAATLPDTIYTKTVSAQRGWFEQLTALASGLVSLSLLVLTIALVPAAWNFRKSYKKISDLLDKVYADVNPLMKHASTVADNLDYITTSVRVDMQKVNQTIAAANQRLQEAVDLTEERLQEFHALLRVVQEEAEETFVSTASAVRGMRTGVAAFGDDVRTAAITRLDRTDHETGDDLFYEGGDDGNDSSTTPEDRRPGPRIRPRDIA